MLTYTMDVEPASLWLRTTPGMLARKQPFYVTEAGLFYGRSGFTTSRSGKDSYLIFYTICGEGTLLQGDQEIRLTEGSAVMINCRTPQSYGTSKKEKKWHHFWIHCDGDGVAAMEAILNPEGVIHPVQVSPVLRDRCERVLALLPRDNVESTLEMGLTVHRILTRMATTRLSSADQSGNRSGFYQPTAASANKERIERSAEYIRAHFTEDLDILQLLEVTHLSRSYFLKLFKEYIGTTPYNYLLCYRITQAKELLELTDLPVREIAEKVGFHDECNFSTRFAKITGETPTGYRASALCGYPAAE